MTTPLYTERGGGDFEKGAAHAIPGIPMGRIGEPREIAEPVCFLLYNEASFITGQVIVPDGGETSI